MTMDGSPRAAGLLGIDPAASLLLTDLSRPGGNVIGRDQRLCGSPQRLAAVSAWSRLRLLSTVWVAASRTYLVTDVP